MHNQTIPRVIVKYDMTRLLMFSFRRLAKKQLVVFGSAADRKEMPSIF
jgi:hypothetical protein